MRLLRTSGFAKPQRFRIWEFPKIRGTLFGVLILGSPIFGNSHIGPPTPKQVLPCCANHFFAHVDVLIGEAGIRLVHRQTLDSKALTALTPTPQTPKPQTLKPGPQNPKP